MGDNKDCNKFNSYLEAYAVIHEKFLSLISLIRSERNLESSKLETHYDLDEKGIVIGYFLFGKVKFTEKTLFEENGEDVISDEWVVVMQYSLKRDGEEEKNKKAKCQKEEKWILEKIVETE
jgi:hypothetical protein